MSSRKPATRGIFLVLVVVLVGPAGADVITSPSDNRDYLAHQLENGLRVLLISDPDTDKSAAALDVRVGSGSDPAERPGLAHLIEHMLFLSNEQYPEAVE